jgi:hypothetical protein
MATQQASNIENLPKDISKEDMDLVNSILNDLDNSNSGGNSGGNQGATQIAEEQIGSTKEEMLEKQKMLEAAQMAQQIHASNISHDLANVNSMQRGVIDNIIDMLKLESKSIFLVIVLAFMFNLEQSNNLLSYYSGAFVEGTNVLSTQGIIIKSLVMGLIYFIVKTQIF